MAAWPISPWFPFYSKHQPIIAQPPYFIAWMNRIALVFGVWEGAGWVSLFSRRIGVQLLRPLIAIGSWSTSRILRCSWLLWRFSDDVLWSWNELKQIFPISPTGTDELEDSSNSMTQRLLHMCFWNRTLINEVIYTHPYFELSMTRRCIPFKFHMTAFPYSGLLCPLNA